MHVFALSFLFFLLAMAGLATGLFLGRGAPRGSCGGLNLADGTRIECGACPRRRRCKAEDKSCNHEAGEVPAGADP